MQKAANLPAAKTNKNTGLLYVIAVICMIIDHVGVIFFPSLVWMRIVGRIALPLFAWGIAVGAEHTKSIAHYALRLLVMTFVSQPFFVYGMGHAWHDLNIFATLFLGLVSIWGLKGKNGWMTVTALLLASQLSMDYGIRGVFCILLLWVVQDDPLALALCFSAYCVAWGAPYVKIWRTEYFDLGLQTTAILALPLLLIPTNSRFRLPRWLMYAMYPAHIGIIWLINTLIK